MDISTKAHVVPHTREQREQLFRLMDEVEPDAIIFSLVTHGAGEVLTAVVLKHTRRTNRLINFIITNFYLANFGVDITKRAFVSVVMALVVTSTTTTTGKQQDNVDSIFESINIYNHTELVITSTSPESVYEDVLLQAFAGLLAVNKLKSIDELIAEREKETK